MSKNLDRILEILDVGKQNQDPVNSGVLLSAFTGYPGQGLCWRCLRNPSRVPGEDFTCEACFAYLNGETDRDPKRRY